MPRAGGIRTPSPLGSPRRGPSEPRSGGSFLLSSLLPDAVKHLLPAAFLLDRYAQVDAIPANRWRRKYLIAKLVFANQFKRFRIGLEDESLARFMVAKMFSPTSAGEALNAPPRRPFQISFPESAFQHMATPASSTA